MEKRINKDRYLEMPIQDVITQISQHFPITIVMSC